MKIEYGTSVINPTFTDEAYGLYHQRGGMEWMMNQFNFHTRHVLAAIKKHQTENLTIVTQIEGLVIVQMNEGDKVNCIVVELEQFKRDNAMSMVLNDASKMDAPVDIEVI